MKILTLVIMVTGIIILLNAGGIQTNSGAIVGNSTLIYNFVNSSAINTPANETAADTGLTNFKNTGFWSSILLILGLGAGIGLVAGFITQTSPTSFIKAPFILLFAGAFLSDLIGLFNMVYGYGIIWLRWLSIAIFVPIGIGLMIIILNWWEGGDN